jgi:hypothetical protein
MGKLSSLLYGAGFGAAMMYFMDKDLGNRRRALVRDKVQRLRYQADDAIDTSLEDLRNRVRGILAEGMATVSNEPINDQVLSERIRSRLGFMARHPRAVDLTVQDGVATLTGDVLAAEVDGLLRGVGRVRGCSGWKTACACTNPPAISPSCKAKDGCQVRVAPGSSGRRLRACWQAVAHCTCSCME